MWRDSGVINLGISLIFHYFTHGHLRFRTGAAGSSGHHTEPKAPCSTATKLLTPLPLQEISRSYFW